MHLVAGGPVLFMLLVWLIFLLNPAPAAAVQAAIATVQAYPWAADLPAIVNCIADDMGEPSCSALLNGQA